VLYGLGLGGSVALITVTSLNLPPPPGIISGVGVINAASGVMMSADSIVTYSQARKGMVATLRPERPAVHFTLAPNMRGGGAMAGAGGKF
jgi:hypothetical protein